MKIHDSITEEQAQHVRAIVRRCRGPHTTAAARRLAKSMRTQADSEARLAGLDPLADDFDGRLGQLLELEPATQEEAKALAHAQQCVAVRSLEEAVRGAISAEDKFLPTLRGKIRGLMLVDREREASLLDEGCRQGCGFDVNALILAHPLDGRQRVVTCPQCGVEITYTPPEA